MTDMSNIQDRLQQLFPTHYRSGKILLINADCMDVMAHIKDGEFELACVDPPYGIEKEISVGGGSHTKSLVKFDCLYSENHKKWDIKPPLEYFIELQRVCHDYIICGGNYFADMLPASRGWAIYDKVTDGVTCVNPELIYTSMHVACKIFRRPQGLNNGFLNKEGRNIHPTQKPYQLYQWLLTNYAKQGQTILDTHLGSGSSAIAAHKMGFEFVGVELDSDYFQAACARFDLHKMQGSLFSPYVPDVPRDVYEQVDFMKNKD